MFAPGGTNTQDPSPPGTPRLDMKHQGDILRGMAAHTFLVLIRNGA